MFEAIHTQLTLSVYQVARTPYDRLHAEIAHDHWAISHVKTGMVETQAGGGHFFAPAGSVMVHPPSLPYSEYAEGAGIHEWIVFECGVNPGLPLFRLHPVAPIVTLSDPLGFSFLFDRLLSAWEKPDSAFRRLHLSGLLTQILGLVLENWQAAGSPARPASHRTTHDRFTELIVYLSQNLARRMTREILAEFVCMQPNSLDRAFRRVYALAPMHMLRVLRLQRARHLLESTTLTLAAIAEQCGFETDAYFSRVFRQQTGVSPGRYRQSVYTARQGYDPPA